MTTDTPPARTTRSALRRVGAVVLGLAAAAVVLPDLVGLDRVTPFAQAVAFRPLLVALLGAVVVLGLGLSALRRRAPVALVGLAVVALTGAGLVLPRALPAPAAADGSELTVLAVNVLGGDADPGEVAAMIVAERPAFVSLPEAGVDYRDRLAPLVPGYRSYTSTGPELADIRGVVALVRDDLGDADVVVDDATPFPTLVVSTPRVRFVAFHGAAPMPDIVDLWRADLAHLSTWCGDADGPPTVVAGDFNATLDHSPFRAGTAGCTDAAAETGAGLIGTWPADQPRWLGTQIDHVLATDGITAEEVTVHDVTGTDHRAVLAHLRLP